jgi:hypothetical protein
VKCYSSTLAHEGSRPTPGTIPADRAGIRVDCFPAHALFPVGIRMSLRAGFTLLRPTGSQPPKAAFVARLRPNQVHPTKPLASFRTNRQLSGWNPPPQVFRAFGAHSHKPTRAARQDTLTKYRRSPLTPKSECVPPLRTRTMASSAKPPDCWDRHRRSAESQESCRTGSR